MNLTNPMKSDLATYGDTIQTHGWQAGETLIQIGINTHGPHFKQWAYALAISLRAQELLEQDQENTPT